MKKKAICLIKTEVVLKCRNYIMRKPQKESLIKTEVVLKYRNNKYWYPFYFCLIKTEVVLKCDLVLQYFSHSRFNKNRSCIEIRLYEIAEPTRESFNKNRSCIEMKMTLCQIHGKNCLIKTEVVLKYNIKSRD